MKTKKRFGKVMTVIERRKGAGEVVYELIGEPRFETFYKRLERIFDGYLLSGCEDKLLCRVEYVSDDYISVLLRAEKRLAGVNYDLAKELFESDKKVLKRENCNKKEISTALKKIDKKLPPSPFAVVRIPDGIALFFDKDEPVRVKIRHDSTKKLNFS